MATQKLSGSADMTSKVHSATFTESLILDKLGMGDEIVTHIKGLHTEAGKSEKVPHLSRFIKTVTGRPVITAMIEYNRNPHEKQVKLQELFDSVHKEIPSFAIQELTIVRKDKEFNEYYLKELETTKEFKYKTWGFKRGTFRRHGAVITPGELVYKKFSRLKNELKDKIPKEVFRRVKDCILLNNNKYNRTEIKRLFLDQPYMLVLEEKDGIFHLCDLGEI